MSRLVITLPWSPKLTLLVLMVLMVMCGTRTRVSGAPQCSPGGRWFDKHAGQKGRWACCSELCEPPGFFTSSCNKKCPGYEELKARAAAEVTVDLATQEEQPEPQPPQAFIKTASNESANISSIGTVLLAVVAVAVAIVVSIVIFVVYRRRKLRQSLAPQAVPGETLRGERGRGGGEETIPMQLLGNAAAQSNGPNTSRTGQLEAQDDRQSLANSNTLLLQSSDNGRSQTDFPLPVNEGGAREGAHHPYGQTAKECGPSHVNATSADNDYTVRDTIRRGV